MSVHFPVICAITPVQRQITAIHWMIAQLASLILIHWGAIQRLNNRVMGHVWVMSYIF